MQVYNINNNKVFMTRDARRPISRTKGKKKRKDKLNRRIFNKIVHRKFSLSLKAVYMNFAKVCSFFVSLDCQIPFHLSSAGMLYSSQIPIQTPDIPLFFGKIHNKKENEFHPQLHSCYKIFIFFHPQG